MKINKKGFVSTGQKCQPSEKYSHAYVLSTWLGPLLHELLPQHGMDAISMWHC